MTEAEFRSATVGTRVKFVPLVSDAGEYSEGTITQKAGQRYEVSWDDGEVYSYPTTTGSRVLLK